MMTDEQLKAIRDRCDKATEGPWDEWWDDDPQSSAWPWVFPPEVIAYDGKDFRGICAFPGNSNGGMGTLADAEFIASAREDVPALLAEVERLRGVLNQRNGQLNNVSELTGATLYQSAPTRLSSGVGNRELIEATLNMVAALSERLTGQRVEVIVNCLDGTRAWLKPDAILGVRWLSRGEELAAHMREAKETKETST